MTVTIVRSSLSLAILLALISMSSTCSFSIQGSGSGSGPPIVSRRDIMAAAFGVSTTLVVGPADNKQRNQAWAATGGSGSALPPTAQELDRIKEGYRQITYLNKKRRFVARTGENANATLTRFDAYWGCDRRRTRSFK
jgi:hypothetical protein